MFDFTRVKPEDDRGVLGWFPVSRCWFTFTYNSEDNVVRPFGGAGNFYGEWPSHWTFCPPAIEED